MKNKDKIFYVGIIIVLVIFAVLSFNFGVERVAKILTTITALISAVAFWLQFKRSERLNESSYIMNLNNQFISNKDMTMVEHELELYYNQYKVMFGNGQTPDSEAVSRLSLGISSSRTSDQCQKLINYLVYLEAIAAIVDQQVIHLEVIDDLFSYRFFLAVNNPVVQENELIPYADFYKGIYKLSEYWVHDHNERHIPIPMDHFVLTTDNLAKLDKDRPFVKVEVSTAGSKDKKTEIAECIYETDSFIYPEAFGEEKETAIKAISRIIGMDNSLLDYRNLLLARYNDQICGVCLTNDGTGTWDPDAIERRIGKDLLPESQLEGFRYASAEYFSKLNNVGADTIELVACCVDDGFRRKHIASKLLAALVEQYGGKTIQLTVLSENTAAIALYEKFGFRIVETDIDGFASAGLKKPKCTVMKRPADKAE